MYIVLEIQTNNGTTSILPAQTFADSAHAEAAFHGILSFAAVSSVEKHGAVILNDDCQRVRSECYYHPAPVPELNAEEES
jgi:hypothetical protein